MPPDFGLLRLAPCDQKSAPPTPAIRGGSACGGQVGLVVTATWFRARRATAMSLLTLGGGLAGLLVVPMAMLIEAIGWRDGLRVIAAVLPARRAARLDPLDLAARLHLGGSLEDAGLGLAALLLGPGWVVNEALKNHWGRARPEQVSDFGGAQRFTPALQPADQCVKNCSFVM